MKKIAALSSVFVTASLLGCATETSNEAPAELDRSEAEALSTTGVRARIAFVSSAAYTGDLGGLAGADAKCQGLASAVPSLAGKTFKALLSDANEYATARFTKDGFFVRMDGRYIGSSLDDILDVDRVWSSIDGPSRKLAIWSPISITEQGDEVDDWVRTATAEKGETLDSDCDGWTRGSWAFEDLGTYAVFGHSMSNTNTWLYGHYPWSICTNEARLYCFEQ